MSRFVRRFLGRLHEERIPAPQGQASEKPAQLPTSSLSVDRRSCCGKLSRPWRRIAAAAPWAETQWADRVWEAIVLTHPRCLLALAVVAPTSLTPLALAIAFDDREFCVAAEQFALA